MQKHPKRNGSSGLFYMVKLLTWSFAEKMVKNSLRIIVNMSQKTLQSQIVKTNQHNSSWRQFSHM
jgi:hypothetical protein